MIVIYDFFKDVANSSYWIKVAGSIAILVITWMVRRIIYRQVRKRSEVLSIDQRKWLQTNKMLTFIISTLVLLVLWLPSLSNVALSLAAFSVATVLALKELMVCISGTWYRVVSHAFKVGDWVEINDIKGEVHDFGLYSTQLLEIGNTNNPYGYTGQMITIPNSLLLNAVIKNQTFKKKYAVHMFDVAMDPKHLKQVELENVQNYINALRSSYKQKTTLYLKDFRDRTGIELKLPEPNVQLKTNEYGMMIYQVTLFCPSDEALHLQNKITEHIFTLHTAGGLA